MLIIDSHTHLNQTGNMMMFGVNVKPFLKQMEFLNCDYMVQSFSTCLEQGFTNIEAYKSYGEDALNAFKESGGKIFSYFIYNPKQADICRETIIKYHDEPAFVGIKIHPSEHWVYADDEGYKDCFELAEKYNLPIMAHTWALTSNPKQKYSVPERFERFVKEFPNVNFVFGHSGGRTSGIKEAVRIGRENKNAYFDLAGDVYNRKLIEYIVNNVGEGRLMIASDIPWFDLSVPIGMVLGADISTEEKENIIGKTAAKLFGIN